MSTISPLESKVKLAIVASSPPYFNSTSVSYTIENGFNLLRAEDLEFLPESLRGKTLKQLEKNNKVSFERLKKLLKFPVIRYLVDKRQSKIQA